MGDLDPLLIHLPIVRTDGGPWAHHDMACAVCRVNHAIIDVGTGRFGPCDSCHGDGWRLVKVTRRGLFRRVQEHFDVR